MGTTVASGTHHDRQQRETSPEEGWEVGAGAADTLDKAPWASATGAFGVPFARPQIDVGQALLAALQGRHDPALMTHGIERMAEIVRAAEENRKLAMVASITANAVAITDAQARIEWVNDAFVRLSGYTLDEARGKTAAELLHGAETDAQVAAWVRGQIRAGIGVSDVEMLQYAKHGGSYWVLLEMQPVRDERGVVVQFVHVETDITARKRAELEALRLNAQLQASIAELEEVNRQTRVVGALRDALQRCETLADIYAATCLHARSLIPGSSGALYAQAAGAPVTSDHLRQATWGETRERSASLNGDSCAAIADGEPQRVRAGSRYADCDHVPEGFDGEYLCLPLAARGATLGALTMELPLDRPHGDAQWQLALSMAQHVSTAIADVKLRDMLRQQATRDPLTGLYNRRYLDDAIEREVHAAHRHGRPLTVCMLDIDHFKRINDGFGHDAGDEVLRAVAHTVAAQLRGEDFVCRFGGEEFVLVLPSARAEDVLPRVNALRHAVSALSLEHRGRAIGTVTVSIGVATLPQHADSAGALLREADRALYRAKDAGRNCVVSAAPDDDREFVRSLAREIL